MKRIGITGNIGTGKSSVKKILEELGKDVIDVDQMNAKLLEKDQLGYIALVEVFGNRILGTSQEIDKEKLAHLIFNDVDTKKQVESILHPLLKKQVIAYLNDALDDVYVEVPLLFEVSWQTLFDEIWLVCTTKDIVLQRLQDYRGMKYEDALIRYESQMPQEEKIGMSDIVLDNNGTYDMLYTQIVNVLKEG